MKQISGRIRFHGVTALLAAVCTTAMMMPAARTMAEDAPASIHGHINNAAGLPLKDAIVKLTTDHSSDPKTLKFVYTFPEDPSGDFKGSGIAPKSYTVVVMVGDVIADYFPDIAFKPGEDKLVNFDMTRKEFIDKMTPEQKRRWRITRRTLPQRLPAMQRSPTSTLP